MKSSSKLENPSLLPTGEGPLESPGDTVRGIAQAADQGDPDAQCALGQVFLLGGDPLTAMNLFRYAHYQGHEPAGLQIGAMCGREDGTPGTDEDIANWYRPIAEEGHPVAQFALAMIYEDGRGVEQSSAEAVRWLRHAGDQGHMVAQNELALMLEYGLGVDRDPKESAKWLRLAAGQGSLRANMTLALKYLHGTGVEEDPEEAERLLLLCSNKGIIDAMATLASLYALGKKLREDHKQAVKWFRRVFDKADADRLYRFGHNLVTIGEVNEGDRFLAYTWCRLAASKGHDVAWDACASLERQISAERLHASRMIARKCIRPRRRTKRSRRRSRRR